MKRTLSIIAALLLSASALATDHKEEAFIIKSNAFKNEQMIPKKFTCQDKGFIPTIYWKNPPAGTKSFALIVDDPDVAITGGEPGKFRVWDHWVVFNIPANTKKLGFKHIPQEAVQGLNSWNENKYGGPCPPDRVHRYFFKLYALDVEKLDLSEKTTAAELHKAMGGHIIKETVLMGKYQPDSN